jgi:hypothetical protein
MTVTLILTELSSLGITMAADSAITREVRKPDGTIGEKVYSGARKLFVVPKLRAGIGYWGWVYLPQPGSDWSSGERTFDLLELWLPSFLDSNVERYNSIADLAELLENELRNRIPKIDIEEYPYGDGGIHLAGYESQNSELHPTFWHIHNGKSQALPDKKLDPTVINANNDLSPEQARLVVEKGLATIRNGDIGPYIFLWGLLFSPDSAFSRIVKTVDLTFPYAENLVDRANLLKFQIETVVGIYRFSREGRGIGGPITTLTISPKKIITYAMT